MTRNKPYLFINRIVVVSQTGAKAYDETFHRGVNIIRGKNSSGKSTIANFIFFVLGGEYTNWTTEALKCREVIAEVEINEAVITLKRTIVPAGSQPMSIFWGSYENAVKDIINWQTYPYKQSEGRVSFTNVLFNALSFPEVKSDADSNITIHQILRLLYIDQDTPTQNLFRFERFDLPLTRQAISEVLLGIYDDELYNKRLQLRNSTKAIEEKKKQFEAISKAYGETGNKTNKTSVRAEIDKAREEIIKIDNEIKKLRESQKIKTTSKTALTSEKVQQELIPVKNKIRTITDQINEYEIEVLDSKQFITTLEKRVLELENSLWTRQVLGELPLDYCPQCLGPLNNHVADGHCFLCKEKLEDEEEKANAKRLKQEMALQIKESKNLLDHKSRVLAELKGELPQHIELARTLQKQLDALIDESQSTRYERLDTLLIAKGGLENQIQIYTQQLKGVELLEELKKEISSLAGSIEILKTEILQKENQQKQKQQLALSKIKAYTLYILKHDLERQREFKTGTSIEVDFQRDTYTLDGSNNFSASSKTYFKNAVLFSIFFASLDLDFFRYPRFILCDNMEDKGMEKERTQNFQKIIADMSLKKKVEHQIIFTTSMIADELNNTSLCVGEEYTVENKTLKI